MMRCRLRVLAIAISACWIVSGFTDGDINAQKLVQRQGSPLATLTVTNTDDSGPGSLRQAIIDANTSPGLDSINFNIPGSGVQTIIPLAALPDIDGPTVIDGASQPDFGGSPLIELNGADNPAVGSGLSLRQGGSGSTVRSLAINRFPNRGIEIFGSGNIIESNYIGTSADGLFRQSNGSIGIWLLSSSNNTIRNNLVSGNGTIGVENIRIDSSSSGNVVKGNRIGPNINGTASLSFVNGLSFGIWIRDAQNNTVGGPLPTDRNLIAGNRSSGVFISGVTATSNRVEGNYIGTDESGTAALANGGFGIDIEDAENTTIGGLSPGVHNLISGNAAEGISVRGAATGTVIQGNYIGTNAAGLNAINNAANGITLASSGSIIGGTATGAGNLISGNAQFGIFVNGVGAGGNVIQGNFVGTNLQGAARIPNRAGGVFIASANNMVGGLLPNSRNVISGNGLFGVGGSGGNSMTLSGLNATENTIQGNYIGVDPTGNASLGNDQSGISILGASNNLIGGTTEQARNVISGHRLDGVYLTGLSSGNSILGNFIGTNASGGNAIPNRSGVWVQGSNNTIGGTAVGSANLIAFNEIGVFIVEGNENSVLTNSVHSNDSHGIDLGLDGATPNDPGDDDTGANNLQNFPILASLTTSGGNASVNGSLNSTPNTTFRVEFFSNLVCDATGNGEGKTYLGSVNVTTNASGDAVINATVSAPAGGFITSTATRLDGGGNPTDTSEFSACLAAIAGTGGELLFSTNRDGNDEIYKMNADGTNQQRLTNSPESEPGGVWSPNGQKILYFKDISPTTSQIWVMNADGSGQTLISDAVGLNRPYQWSPDGQKIVFTIEQDPSSKIWVMNADGSNKIQLTNPPTVDTAPAWSPDGSKIVFERCNTESVCDIYTMNSNGSNQTNLTPTTPQDVSPSWSPDGTKIIFSGQSEVFNSNAFVMNTDGSNRQALTNSVFPQIVLAASRFPIAPDGSKVALFSVETGSNTFEIATVGINGSGFTNLTSNTVNDIFSAWSPDSSRIAFQSERDAVSGEIYVMNANGTGVVRLTNNAAADAVTDWYRPTSGPTCSSAAINFGQSFSGTLNGASCIVGSDKADLYTFAGTSGQQIAIAMETSQFFAKIELLNPAGAVIQTVGGLNGVNNSRLPANGFVTLPTNGTYTIRAIAGLGGSGGYTLSLYEAPVGACTYSLSPERTDVPQAGGTFSFDVVTQPGCPPAGAPAASGTFYTGATYSGGRVTFSVPAHLGVVDRQEAMTVAGQQHTISQYCTCPPTNDFVNNPNLLIGANSLPDEPERGSNGNASAQAGEPAHAGQPAMRSVWYVWTAPANGLWSFSTSGSSFDTVMAIYRCPGALPTCTFANLTPVGSNDDTTFFDVTSKVNFRADQGATYMIAVDGKNGATGTIELSWRQYSRLFRLYLQNFNGNQSPLVPDTVTASNGSNTVTPLLVSLGVYEFNLPPDGTTYNVTIAGPTGIVWNPNNFPLETSFRYLDELMQGEGGSTTGQNVVSNAQNQTPRYVYGFIKNILSAEVPSLAVRIGSSRGPNPVEERPCSPLGFQSVAGVPYATYQCESQPNTLHDIVPNMAGKSFTVSVLSFPSPINTTYNGTPGSSFIASNVPTYNITGRVLAGGAGTRVDLTYTPPGNTQPISQRATTTADGSYSFTNLTANTYRLKAMRTGFVYTEPAPVSLQSNQTIDIASEAACSYNPPATITTIPVAGGLSQFTVTTNQPNCEWLAASDVSWITINSGAIVGNGPVHFTAQSNAGAGRIGSIRIQGRTDPILVQQATTSPTFGTIAGRVLTPGSIALRNAVVTIIDAEGNRQTATTSSFGVYSFGNVQLGQIYTATVTSRRYRFTPKNLVLTASASGFDFMGLE